MKSLLTLLFLALGMGLFAAPQTGSADFYRTTPSKYLDKHIKIFVVGAELSASSTIDSYVAYLAKTISGDIYILVPEKKSKVFSNNMPRYNKATGESSSTKSYSGTFVKVKVGAEDVYALKTD